MKTDVKRRGAVGTLLVIGIVVALAAPALAFAGGGRSATTDGDKKVEGSGTFVVDMAVGTSHPPATVTCVVEATPAEQVVSTAVEKCELFKGTTRVLTAPASARQSPVWATAERAPSSLVPEGEYLVCWTVRAIYDDASQLTNEDCGTQLVAGQPRPSYEERVQITTQLLAGGVLAGTFACEVAVSPHLAHVPDPLEMVLDCSYGSAYTSAKAPSQHVHLSPVAATAGVATALLVPTVAEVCARAWVRFADGEFLITVCDAYH